MTTNQPNQFNQKPSQTNPSQSRQENYGQPQQGSVRPDADRDAKGNVNAAKKNPQMDTQKRSA